VESEEQQREQREQRHQLQHQEDFGWEPCTPPGSPMPVPTAAGSGSGSTAVAPSLPHSPAHTLAASNNNSSRGSAHVAHTTTARPFLRSPPAKTFRHSSSGTVGGGVSSSCRSVPTPRQRVCLGGSTPIMPDKAGRPDGRAAAAAPAAAHHGAHTPMPKGRVHSSRRINLEKAGLGMILMLAAAIEDDNSISSSSTCLRDEQSRGQQHYHDQHHQHHQHHQHQEYQGQDRRSSMTAYASGGGGGGGSSSSGSGSSSWRAPKHRAMSSDSHVLSHHCYAQSYCYPQPKQAHSPSLGTGDSHLHPSHPSSAARARSSSSLPLMGLVLGSCSALVA
jgi:hypothetical protein